MRVDTIMSHTLFMPFMGKFIKYLNIYRKLQNLMGTFMKISKNIYVKLIAHA